MSTLDRVVTILGQAKPGIGTIDATTDLSDALDSLDIVEMLATIEDEFGCEVDPEDIVPENFASASTIAALVDRSIG